MRTALDINAVRSFVAIVDVGGFTRASQELELSQSTVSAHVKRLETSLGASLLTRRGQVPRLTAFGSRFLVQAKRLLAAHDAVLAEPLAASSGQLFVGITEAAIGLLDHDDLDALKPAIAELNLDLIVDDSVLLQSAVEKNQIDAAVILSFEPTRGLRLGSAELTWLAADDYPSRRTQDELDLVVKLNPSRLRDHMIETLIDHRIGYRITSEGRGPDALLSSIRAGLGVTALPLIGDPPGGVQPLRHLPPLGRVSFWLIEGTNIDPIASRRLRDVVVAAKDRVASRRPLAGAGDPPSRHRPMSSSHAMSAGSAR